MFVPATNLWAQENNLAMPPVAKSSDFRGFVWGVSKAEVRKYEKAAFYQEKGDRLYFLEHPSKKDVMRKIRYDFTGDILTSARYEFEDLHFTSPNQAVDFYDDVRRHISKIKGPFEKEEFIWRDPTYKRYPQFWPRAVRMGDLVMKTFWSGANATDMSLTLRYERPYFALVFEASRAGGDGKNLFLIPQGAGAESGIHLNP